MNRSIDYSAVIKISGGPTLDISGAIDVEAYELIEISVPADNNPVKVNLPVESGYQLLVIKSTNYADLTYDVNDGRGGVNTITLDGPHILIGAGVIDRLGASPSELIFRKSAGDEATVTILVGTARNRYSQKLQRGQIEPKRVEGGKYPAVQPDLERVHNEDEDDKPYYVPKGPDRGRFAPDNSEYGVKEGSRDSQSPLFFEVYDEIDDAAPSTNLFVPEPSVAENGQTIMTTGNYWMSLSLDGGLTFTSVNPTTIFPQDYGGFCCDQVVQYVPEFDLFVWLLQYGSNAGVNAIRIAVQTTQGVRSSNGTAWTYWDFTNNIFATSGALDYNDMSFGSRFLYWSSSVGGGANRYVIRVPLSELQAMGTVNFQFTGSTNAYWSHVTQNGSDGVYWAGHVDNSTMKVYSMMDADGFYSWREVPINSWPNSTISSIAANGTDWLQDASWKTYIRAAAISGNSVYFAWIASSGGGFSHPHVQIVRINTGTFVLEAQMQIWNPDFAFAYPYFDTNAEGELGMIVAFGGGPYDASSGVGVWGDFVIYYPRLSSSSRNNYGHYHTARRAGSDRMKWVGAGYTRVADGSNLPYYVKFSR